MDLYDIHCHLIPGVDDGSQTMEESLEAMKLEYEEGVRHIICTSHFSAVLFLQKQKIPFSFLSTMLQMAI